MTIDISHLGHRQLYVLEELEMGPRTGRQLGVPFDTLDRLNGRGLINSRTSHGWRDAPWGLTSEGRQLLAEMYPEEDYT